jgi:hypothetical protein
LCDAAPAGDQQRIGVTVVAAVELYDLVASRGTPREAHSAHDRLSTGRDESHLFEAGDALRHGFGEQHLTGGGRTKRRTVFDGVAQHFDDIGVGVPEQ